MNYIKNLLNNLRHPAGIAGVIIALLIPFLIYLAPNSGYKDLIQNLDVNLAFWLFLVQFILGIALFIGLFKDFRTWITERLPGKRYLIALGVFTILAIGFAATQIEARHRVQSDESVFLSVAQNLYYNQESVTCNEGEFQGGTFNCENNSDSFKTKGLSFLYVIGMPVFGTSLHWIFNLELAFLFLAMILFFFALRAWTADDFLSLIATVLLFAQPTVLFQFRSASVEPLYVLCSALALLSLKWAVDRNTLRHWILFALILAFFAQTRQETLFCFLAFLVFACPKLLEKKDWKAPAFLVTLSVFSVPVLLTISYFQGYNFQGGEFSAHGHFIENLRGNWDVMTNSFKDGALTNPFLASFNYLFLTGLVILVLRAAFELYKAKKPGFYTWTLLFLALYHIQTYMVLENVSGDFTIEINQRYSLVMLPSMAFLGALAIREILFWMIKALGFSKFEKSATAVFIACAVASAAIAGNTLSYRQDFNDNIMYNRNHLTNEEVEIWKWLKLQPEKPRLFVYARPWHFVGYGVSAIHYDRVRSMSDADYNALLAKYNGEVYYIRGLDCWDSHTYHVKAVEHRIATTCDVFEREMKMDPVFQTLITNNYWLQIAKLREKRGYDPEALFKFGFWQGTPEKRQVIVDYSMPVNQTQPWKVSLILNGKDTVKTMPYTMSSPSDTLKGTLIPGYNRFDAVITDTSTGETVVRSTSFRFFRFEGALSLTDIEIRSNSQGWGDLQKDKSLDGHTFTVNGETFENGYGTHAPSDMAFDLGGKYLRFSAIFGLDDESLCSDGVKIRIVGDGRTLYESDTLHLQQALPVSIPVQGINDFHIQSDALANNNCDHIDIIQPTLFPPKISARDNAAYKK